MTMSALTGSRMRERRLALGLGQAELAGTIGISASYLNLIEHNRRRIAAPLLERLAGALSMPVSSFQEGAESAVLDDLRAAAARMAGGTGDAALPELDRIEDFAGRFPGWARVLSQLEARAAGMERALEAMNERISHDPHLSASLHEVLSAVSSVRSIAAILAETEDIEPEWRTRFHQNLHQDSERLAAGAEALVAYLDEPGQAEDQGVASPQEEVEVWLQARGWQLAEVESGGVAAAENAISGLASGAARVLARAWVAQSAADAVALPEPAFSAALVEIGPDPARLAARFGVDILMVFRRIAMRPGAVAGLVICDASGTLTFRKPVVGFTLPRFGAACPLWPLFAALGRPMSPLESVIETPGPGVRRFRALAFCQPRFPDGFRGPELREAAMLIIPEPVFVGQGTGLAVGSSCRICLRTECPARREPSILTG